MADNYLGKKMEDHMARSSQGAKPRTQPSLGKLLLRNRSHRTYDASFRVREDQLRRMVAAAALSPSAMNRQPLRYRLVCGEEVAKVLPLIRLGGALPELKLPPVGCEPNGFIVCCSDIEPDKYLYMDLGIAAQSMLLQAVEIGLNGICIGAFDHAALREALGLQMEPLLVIAVGRGVEHIELTEISASESHTYYRRDGVHYVPKVRLDELIIK